MNDLMAFSFLYAVHSSSAQRAAGNESSRRSLVLFQRKAAAILYKTVEREILPIWTGRQTDRQTERTLQQKQQEKKKKKKKSGERRRLMRAP